MFESREEGGGRAARAAGPCWSSPLRPAGFGAWHRGKEALAGS